MLNRPCIAAALIAVSVLATAGPANAAGEILITHAKALAGNVTPGDAAGYPVTISIPGKFQFASNLFVAANKIGIQVTSKNVTIDLNGFTIEGSDVAWYGIVGGVNSVTVESGTITRFRFDGINTSGKNWKVENMRVVSNGRDGLSLNSAFVTVRKNEVTENVGRGLFCTTRCLVQDNIISHNGTVGIEIGEGVILGNVIISNGGNGISVIDVDEIGFVSATGYAHNVVALNGGDDQAVGVIPLTPNYCLPFTCP